MVTSSVNVIYIYIYIASVPEFFSAPWCNTICQSHIQKRNSVLRVEGGDKGTKGEGEVVDDESEKFVSIR